MNWFCQRVAYLTWLVMPPLFVYRIIYDFRHPEEWGTDPYNDPRLYLPMLGVVVLLGIWFVWECHKLVKLQDAIERRRQGKTNGIGNGHWPASQEKFNGG